jgi:hypothetical protein
MEEIVRDSVTIGADIVLRFVIFGGEGFEWKEVVNMFDHPHFTKSVASKNAAESWPVEVRLSGHVPSFVGVKFLKV